MILPAILCLNCSKKKGVNVNATNINQETPLINAVLKNGLRMAKLLIQAGVNVDAQSKTKDTALHWAARMGNLELSSLLMEAGADPELQGGDGTPIQCAKQGGHHEIVKRAEEITKKKKKEKALIEWLKDLGLEKYARNLLKEEFDLDSLPLLSEDDLKKLEIPTAPRLKILNAVKESQKQKAKKSNFSSSSSSSLTPPSSMTSSASDQFNFPSMATVIDYEDLKLGDLLGKGYFAEVRKATWNGTEVAVKKLYRETFSNKNEMELFYKEVEILSKLRFPYIVQFIGLCVGEHKCIITEYMADGSLHSLLHSSDQNEELLQDREFQLSIALDIARGMNYLHTHKPPIVHRDLTSKNILLDSKHAKVADFGLSREQGIGEMTSSVGALPWVAPEVFKGAPYSMAADVYSYGVILWELFTGKDPHGDSAPLVHAQRVAFEQFRPPIPSSIPPHIRTLIETCWQTEPTKRPKFEDIIHLLTDSAVPEAEVMGYLDSDSLAKARADMQKQMNSSGQSNSSHFSNSSSSSPPEEEDLSEESEEDSDEEEWEKKMRLAKEGRTVAPVVDDLSEETDSDG
eukprot:TRINITY_DN1356_c0_g2_i5.p1 TRINITY_DN1356_c0_g2~~TRINITY_DN1356_c0_g2_i5.p1  ORF type:complete len:573 (+),score=151.87 TRINITY_DN1356_c0_g2_i5:542-2260(+)